MVRVLVQCQKQRQDHDYIQCAEQISLRDNIESDNLKDGRRRGGRLKSMSPFL